MVALLNFIASLFRSNMSIKERIFGLNFFRNIDILYAWEKRCFWTTLSKKTPALMNRVQVIRFQSQNQI